MTSRRDEIQLTGTGEAAAAAVTPDVLEVRNLHTYFRRGRGVIKAVRGVSFTLGRAGSMGLVGESGSGKSVTALSIMGLVDPPGFIAEGQILLAGTDLAGLRRTELSKIQGRDLAMVFQEPAAALNPLYPVGRQVAEAIRAHQDVTRAQAADRVRELFELVGIADGERVARQYPHHLSGGLCQRVVIATALANEPRLLILDEPTTALDTTIQAQILDVVKDLTARLETAILFVSHDISVVAELCGDLAVMYGGKIMESGDTQALIADPKHPYTVGLIDAALSVSSSSGGRLKSIPGEVPDPQHLPPGCPFAPRCSHVMDKCGTDPELKLLPDGRQVACWLY